MNLFICGQKSFGAAVLKELHSRGHNIAGVAPPPQEKYYDKIRVQAISLGLPVISDCDRLIASDIPKRTDLIVAAHSHWFISSRVLAATTYGGIGFHPSLLPRHRGQDAVRWAVAMGDAITGVSVYWLNDKIDAGPVFSQKPIFIERGSDHQKLWREIFPLGVKMLCDAVDDIACGVLTADPQDERFATWEPAYRVERLKRNDLLCIESQVSSLKGR